MSFFPCCTPVGTGPPGEVPSVINIGNEAEWYVVGTSTPFEFRTAESSDGSIGITQGASTLDFIVDFGSNVSIANVGGGAEVWVDPSDNPFKLRTHISSDGSVTIVQGVETNDFTVVASAGAVVFQVDDDTSTKSTTSTAYQTLATLATDPASQIKDEEVWKINICLLVCHPVNVFTVNTFVRWSIETSAGVFTQIDEWQINAPITIQVGEPSIPFHRTRNVTIAFDDPRMLVEIRMSAGQASPTFAEDPRWGGVRISAAP